MEDDAGKQTGNEARAEGNLRSAIFKYGLEADIAEEIFDTAESLPGIEDETLRDIDALEKQFEETRGLEKEFFDWEAEQEYDSDALYKTIREAGDHEDVMALARQIDRDATQLDRINHAALETLQKANIDTGNMISDDIVVRAVENALPDDYATQDDVRNMEEQLNDMDASIDYERVINEVVDGLPDDYATEQKLEDLRTDLEDDISAVSSEISDVGDRIDDIDTIDASDTDRYGDRISRRGLVAGLLGGGAVAAGFAYTNTASFGAGFLLGAGTGKQTERETERTPKPSLSYSDSELEKLVSETNGQDGQLKEIIALPGEHEEIVYNEKTNEYLAKASPDEYTTISAETYEFLEKHRGDDV